MVEPQSDSFAQRASLAFAQSFTRQGETAATVTVADEIDPFPPSPSSNTHRAILAQRRAAHADGSLARVLDRM